MAGTDLIHHMVDNRSIEAFNKLPSNDETSDDGDSTSDYEDGEDSFCYHGFSLSDQLSSRNFETLNPCIGNNITTLSLYSSGTHMEHAA